MYGKETVRINKRLYDHENILKMSKMNMQITATVSECTKLHVIQSKRAQRQYIQSLSAVTIDGRSMEAVVKSIDSDRTTYMHVCTHAMFRSTVSIKSSI